jgi:hypothetical protein
MKEKILNAIGSPKELEALYRQNPMDFQKEFPEIFDKNPDSVVLQVWHERLISIASDDNQQKNNMWPYKTIFLLIALTAIAGTLMRLPISFEKIDPLVAYFFFQIDQSKKNVIIVVGLAVGALLFLNFLPFEFNGSSWEFHRKYRSFDDAITVAELHVPLFLWLALGVVFAGKRWMENSGRMSFLKYNGEVIVYSTIILIGGMVLTGITIGLLTLIERSYELTEWYTENVIPYGIVAAPLVASFLIDKVIGKRLNLAPTLAKIFTPLFLVTTISYLVLLAVYRQSPFNDRENLMVFNILLIIVLGLLIFSIAERDPSASVALSDYMNIGLVVTTLIIDLIALSAVLFRMSNDIYGLTPNRTAILGINLLVFFHLVGIFYHYVRFALKKNRFLNLENWIAKYLPIYAVWALVISVVLPLTFWYR